MPLRSVVALVILGFMATSARAALWNCTVLNAYDLVSDGSIKQLEKSMSPNPGDQLLYDEATGKLRMVSKATKKVLWSLDFEVWQHGSNDNAAIAIYRYRGPVSNPLITLRVMAYQQGQTKPFIFNDDGGTVSAGTCSVVADR
jgi:hypothetical protein